MTIIAQINVPTTKRISKDAKSEFFRMNCIGGNAKLNTKFKMKGNATMKGISFLNASKNT